jgi:SAM-dependent methyltransferase
MGLLTSLREPALTDIDVDGVERFRAHRQIIDRKPMIRTVFTEIHQQMLGLEKAFLTGEGHRIEIGAGVYPIRESDPGVLATDLVAGPGIDRALDAQNMDVADNSVRAIFGQHCFHHLPEPERFLGELRRVLVPGGGAILVEPYWGPVASVMYKRLFANETFDKHAATWETPPQGAMTGANQALSYIVFERDRKRYEASYPDLPIVHHSILTNHLRYLLSGGLNFKQLAPDAATSFLKTLERLSTPLGRCIGLHHVIVLRKNAT